MQAVLASGQASATMSTSCFANASPCVFTGNLGSISVGASLGAVQALLQGLPTGVRLLTFVGATAERQSTWARVERKILKYVHTIAPFLKLVVASSSPPS
jgi:hypothetical protein